MQNAAPLKPLFPNHRWMLEDGYGHVLGFPDDWYAEYDPVTDGYTSPQLRAVEQLILEETDEWKYVEGQYLVEVADTLLEDWCDFYRLRAPISSLTSFKADFWQASEKKTLPQWLMDRVDLVFICLDGVRWEIYTEDEQVLQTARTHLHTVPYIEVGDSTLEEHLFWLHGQPRSHTGP